MAIKLYIVDDHALFREGLLRLLEVDPALEVAGSAGSVSDALRDLTHMQVDILILDYDLGSDNALTLARALRERSFAGRILVVTAGLPDHHALELIRLGCYGILHKNQPPAELHRSILSVAAGQVLLDQAYLQRLAQEAVAPQRPRIKLTERDKQVLRLVLQGLSNKEIGTQLAVSESAIKSSLQQLFAKTGVRTRSNLVRLALEDLRDDL